MNTIRIIITVLAISTLTATSLRTEEKEMYLPKFLLGKRSLTENSTEMTEYTTYRGDINNSSRFTLSNFCKMIFVFKTFGLSKIYKSIYI